MLLLASGLEGVVDVAAGEGVPVARIVALRSATICRLDLIRLRALPLGGTRGSELG